MFVTPPAAVALHLAPPRIFGHPIFDGWHKKPRQSAQSRSSCSEVRLEAGETLNLRADLVSLEEYDKIDKWNPVVVRAVLNVAVSKQEDALKWQDFWKRNPKLLSVAVYQT